MENNKRTIVIKNEIYGDEAQCPIDEKIALRPILSVYGRTVRIAKSEDGKYMIVIHPTKGNNIIVPCEDLETVTNFLERIILNLEKARLDDEFVSAQDGERVKVESPRTFQEEDKGMFEQKRELFEELYKLYGIEFDGFILHKDYNNFLKESPNREKAIYESVKRSVEEDRYFGLLDEHKELSEEDNAKADELLNEIVKIIAMEECQYIVANIDQITIGGRPLEKTRNIAQQLLDRAKVSGSEETLIDFNTLGYSNAVQD